METVALNYGFAMKSRFMEKKNIQKVKGGVTRSSRFPPPDVMDVAAVLR